MKGRGMFPSLLDFPVIAAILADTYGFRDVHSLLLPVPEDLEDQRRNGQEDPLDGDPPPTHEDPPENAVMLILQLYLVYDLDIHILTAAFRTTPAGPPYDD